MNFLCHYLEHQYTETSLSLSRLVRGDLQVVTRVAHAAEQTDFIVYLVTFERRRVGCHDEIDSEVESEFESRGDHDHELHEGDEILDEWVLEKVVTLDGTYVAEDILIGRDDMVDPEALDEYGPDKEEYSG